jgi:hypothetical protein
METTIAIEAKDHKAECIWVEDEEVDEQISQSRYLFYMYNIQEIQIKESEYYERIC